jgi:ferrous iron transport protein A/ferrous iron transport protein B
MDTTKLCCANIDSVYKVVNVSGICRARLSEFGFTKNTEVRIVRHMMNNGPIEVAIRDFHIALRHEEAENITVIKIERK